jgi:hypothetical protein
VGAIWDCFSASAGSFLSPAAPFSHETQHPMAGRRVCSRSRSARNVGEEGWKELRELEQTTTQEECVWGEGRISLSQDGREQLCSTVLRCCLSRVSVCFQRHGLPVLRASPQHAFGFPLRTFFKYAFPWTWSLLNSLRSRDERCLPEFSRIHAAAAACRASRRVRGKPARRRWRSTAAAGETC